MNGTLCLELQKYGPQTQVPTKHEDCFQHSAKMGVEDAELTRFSVL